MPERLKDNPRARSDRTQRAMQSPQVWGPAVQAKTQALEKYLHESQEELVALVWDVCRGPLARLVQDGISYLNELRREFLRVHRRLVVGLRTHEAESVLDLLRIELADLNERLRAVVLGRASRMSQPGWKPSTLVHALERTVEILPRRIEAEFEDRTFARNAQDPLGRAIARAGARLSVQTRRVLGGQPMRLIELQQLAHYHLVAVDRDRLEGLAALFVQADAQLVAHSRIILDGIARGFETVREHADRPDISDVLATFRQQVEEEFQLAEVELHRLADEGGLRTAKLLGEAMRGFKQDLPIIGSFELSNRRRRPDRGLSTQTLALEDLEARVQRVRHSISSSYVMLGLHLEYASYRARVRVVLGRQLSELKKDVRGRSHTQIERVIASVQDALAQMNPEADPEAEQDPDAEAPTKTADDLRVCLEPLERVLSAALLNANQLLEQLTEEQFVAPLLDALNREAQGLTNRYEVPAGKLPHAEWRLPAPLSIVEVRLAELVSAYIQTDIAPELLRVTQAAVGVIQPVVSAFHDLERVVSIDPDHFSEDQDLLGEASGTPAGLNDVALAALARSETALQEVLERSDSWSDDLVESFKKIVFTHVDALRERLSEGHVGQLRSARARGGHGPRSLSRQADRITGQLDAWGATATHSVRRFFGERRLLEWRRQLGLPGPRVDAEEATDLLAAPKPHCEIPLYYRRLFSSNAQWAGDLLPEQRRGCERIKKVLGRKRAQGLRTAAVLSPDGSGQGALLAAITRGERLGHVRRISFSRPVGLEEIDELFSDLGQGQLLLVSGFRWLLSAGPGGYGPLRRFLSGVLADGTKNAWVIEAASMVWQFAQQVAPVREVFAEVLEVGPINGEEMESALRARHQLSGMALRFNDDLEDSDSAVLARDRFFSTLHRVSNGYLNRALPLWIASVCAVQEDEGFVQLGLPPPSAQPVLELLEDESCVVLLSVLRQGWMNSETLAHLFRWTQVEAEGRLMFLVGEGLLERLTGGVFLVRRHLRQDVQAVLRQRRWCP